MISQRIYFIFGHSYNPFTLEWDEEKQLEYIARAENDATEFQNRIDELTGVFVMGWVDNEKLNFIVDPSGMQSAYYGSSNDKFIVTSHTQLADDLFGF